MSADDDLDDLLEHLERTRAERRDLIADLTMDLDRARRVEDPLRRAQGLLDGYEDDATGTGDFGAYLEFRSSFDELVEGLDADLPHRSSFEAAQDELDHRRLNEGHFEAARDALEPARETATTLESIRDLDDELGRLRRALEDRRVDLEDRRDRLEELVTLDPTALETPVDPLKEPVDRYNEAVTDAFDRYLADTPARDVLSRLSRMEPFALLDVDVPPSALVAFLEDDPVGDESVPQLLEYLDFSRSKLDHYVDDPGRFVAEVRPHAPYLEGLSADPFRIDWPPPAADTMRWVARELHQAVGRFAGADTMETLREVESLVREPDRYDALRTAAVARVELDPPERELVRSGRAEDELASVEADLDRIESALSG